jgi:hypothetical protein
MTSKLEVYNFALGNLGERKLASLSEAVEARRVLDDYYPQTAAACLESGLWNFAKRGVAIEASEDIDPAFGWTGAFEKPTDWVNTIQLSENEFFEPPLLHLTEEAGVWYANATLLYVEYISNSTSWGMDLSLWPPSFTDYVAASLARRVCKRLTSSDTLTDKMENLEDKMRRNAKSRDAMNQPPGRIPTGTWVRSRGNGLMRSRWDGTTR